MRAAEEEKSDASVSFEVLSRDITDSRARAPRPLPHDRPESSPLRGVILQALLASRRRPPMSDRTRLGSSSVRHIGCTSADASGQEGGQAKRLVVFRSDGSRLPEDTVRGKGTEIEEMGPHDNGRGLVALTMRKHALVFCNGQAAGGSPAWPWGGRTGSRFALPRASGWCSALRLGGARWLAGEASMACGAWRPESVSASYCRVTRVRADAGH